MDGGHRMDSGEEEFQLEQTRTWTEFKDVEWIDLTSENAKAKLRNISFQTMELETCGDVASHSLE